MATSWDALVEHATSTLPATELATSYGTPALKVAGALLCRVRGEDGLVVVRCSPEEKQALVEGDDPAWSTTPHYDGHGSVLVDLERVDEAELHEVLDAGWWLVAPARVRDARGRPGPSRVSGSRRRCPRR